jgi:twitching motility protein PilI
MDSSALTLLSDPSLRDAKLSKKNLGDAYLKFEIGQDIQAGLLMTQIQEVLVLPSQYLTPMPNMAAEILGLMHRRSRVLWVIDLAMLLGVGMMDYRPQQYDIVILRTGSTSVAAAVRRVEGIAWVLPDALHSPPTHIPPGLLPYTRGCILQPQNLVFLLDGEAILQAPILQNS